LVYQLAGLKGSLKVVMTVGTLGHTLENMLGLLLAQPSVHRLEQQSELPSGLLWELPLVLLLVRQSELQWVKRLVPQLAQQ
jgi:hypothetical protein